MTYKLVKLKEVLKQYKKLITLSSDIEYKQVTIKMYGKGVILRGIQKGFDIQTKNQYLVKKGQFIISKIDARNGAFGKIPDDLDGAIISNSFASFDIDTKLLNIDYLILFSKTDDFVNACIGKSEGTTNRQSVKIDDFLELEIPLPTLEEQEKIVKKLESINNKIEKIKLAKEKNNIKILREQILKQAIEGKLVAQNPNDEPASILLEKIKQEKEKLVKEGKSKKDNQLLNGYNESPFEIPENWVWCKLGEISFLITDGKHGDCSNEINSGYYFLSAKDIKNGKLDYSNPREINYNEFLEVHKRTNLKPGDICIVNTGATIGKIAIVQDDVKTDKTTFQKSVALIKVVNYFIHNLFIGKLLESIIKDLLELSKGGAINNLLLGDLKNLLIPLPPLEEQKRIVEKIEDFEEKLNKLDKLQTKQLKELEAFKNAILDKALSGELLEGKTNYQKERVHSLDYFKLKQEAGVIVKLLQETGYPRGEMAIAKYFYLLDIVSGEKSGINYERHYFGPYSPEIKKILNSKKDKFFIIGNKNTIILGENSKKLFNYKDSFLDEIKNGMNYFLNKLGFANKKSEELELFATICKIVEDIKTLDLDEIILELKKWVIDKDGKTKWDKFKNENISNIINLIVREGIDKKLI